MSTVIPLQTELRPQLPTVEGNVDYRTFRQQLEHIDQLLAQTGLETDFVAASLRHWESQACAPLANVSVHQQEQFQEHSRRALRCNLARMLPGRSLPALQHPPG